jgi:hypothetical protein
MSDVTSDSAAPAGSAFLPITESVTIGAETIVAKEFTTKQVLKILKQIGAVVKTIRASGEGANLLDLISDNADAVLELVAMSTGKDIAWVGEQRPLDTIQLTKAVFAVNKGFFYQLIQALPRKAVAPASASPQPTPSETSTG